VVIAPSGEVTPHIRGKPLDGTHGNQMLSASGGADGDFQQAMGPMQIIPDTWRLYAVDAHNDGMSSPDNLDEPPVRPPRATEAGPCVRCSTSIREADERRGDWRWHVAGQHGPLSWLSRCLDLRC
jgi:hypothetical protein